MSHIVEIKTEVRDAAGVRAACDRLLLEPPVEGKSKLFSREVEGLAVRLRDWRYPVVFKTTSGEAQFDNYGGRWANSLGWISFCRLMPLSRRRSRLGGRGTQCPNRAWRTVPSS